MFTGIITHAARVLDARPTPSGTRFTIQNPGFAVAPGTPAGPGESIAVNGVCLTVLDDPPPTDTELRFDIITETLNRTTLGSLKPGDLVHTEHAATASTLLSGHVVQGHVDAVGTVDRVADDPADWRLWVRVPAHTLRLIAPKGSITIDGVSLTVAEVDTAGARFAVALIPTTLERTRLGKLVAGESVNIETDVIARQVAHYLDHAAVTTSPGTLHP